MRGAEPHRFAEIRVRAVHALPFGKDFRGGIGDFLYGGASVFAAAAGYGFDGFLHGFRVVFAELEQQQGCERGRHLLGRERLGDARGRCGNIGSAGFQQPLPPWRRPCFPALTRPGPAQARPCGPHPRPLPWPWLRAAPPHRAWHRVSLWRRLACTASALSAGVTPGTSACGKTEVMMEAARKPRPAP